jgi:hypothetical protein
MLNLTDSWKYQSSTVKGSSLPRSIVLVKNIGASVNIHEMEEITEVSEIAQEEV